MKVGDLVALKLCQRAGNIGMITCTHYVGHDGLGLYYVLVDTQVRGFTRNQLVRLKWMEK